ncbi:MAG: transcription termination factor NusA [Bacteroidota bacterium]
MNHDIVESFTYLVRERGIDKDILLNSVEDIFGMMVKKKYGNDSKYEIVVNMDKGDIEIYLEKEIVSEVITPETQIDVETARAKSGEELSVGEDYVEIIPIENFGRKLVALAKQNFIQRIKEIERDVQYNEYSQMIGEIVVGEVYQIRYNDIIISHNKNELLLPRGEQIVKEKYKKGDTVRGVVKEVRKGTGGLSVIISRSDNQFMARLFEIEIPEVYDGIIEIKGIARDPGERAKVAVISHNDRIDAVGACVGMKGVRIHSIVRELCNENIDVVNYSADISQYIVRALAPAKIKEITVDQENKRASILVAEDQASLAIGRGGQNVRLATKLTGYEIAVIREEEEYDVDLEEYQTELGVEILERLLEADYKSAKDVLEANIDDICKKTEIEKEKVEQIIEIIRKGYEEAENEVDENKPAE